MTAVGEERITVPQSPEELTEILNDTNRLDDAQFNRVALSLKDLMMFDPDDRIVRRGGELKVELFHTSLLLRELSDGFQSVVAMICSISPAHFASGQFFFSLPLPGWRASWLRVED